jgi:MOSC domain-containing protein YiiM
MLTHDAVQVKAGRGIVGDRYYRKHSPSTSTQKRAKNVINHITLIEEEALALFNQELSLDVPAAALRRNLLTRGIRLNVLVGRDFSIGNILMRGIELSEPCSVIGQLLQTQQVGAATIIKTLHLRGGLRAEILSSGIIRTSDPISTDLQ